ncbi:MAG TPA: UvrD-helicase domain-containing protein [Longimicrobiales bacterium]|nr:UvrD-helicase domain-containing protein [Longimicrobiales bacterium]
MNHLQGLNPEQRRAVQHTEGPLLILAGAGSGKTKTLVHRVVHLIRARRVAAARIVAVTFTNRAADEMRERVLAYAPDEARGVVVSTFHALGARILRDYHERAALPKRFAIYSTADQLGALRTACAEIAIADDSFELKRVLRQVSDWKNRGLEPADARGEVMAAGTRGNRSDDYAVLAADAYPKYQEVLRACGALDFDDLLLRAVRLLDEDETVRRELWKRWHYFLIDEYQDTNAVQLRFARLLAGPRRNLCVVGDDDQSIYAFRGADLGNILAFEQHFPGARLVTLEQNYRSTQRILGAANAIIAGNRHRHPKRLRTANGVGAAIDICEHEDEVAEAEAVAREISVRRFAGKARWEDLAVLYRTNPQARVLEEALRAQGIPYRVVGGTSFFDRKEIADCLSYLRVAAVPADELALRRIINFPPRGIGRATVLKVAERARADGVPFVRALTRLTAADTGVAGAEAIRRFADQLDEARAGLARAEAAAAAGPPPPEALSPIAQWAEDWFRELRIMDAVTSDPRNLRSAGVRADNIRDLAGTIARYERRQWQRAALEGASWQPPSLNDALARLALAELDRDEEDGADQPAAVTLMTLHSAKGLEFGEVFLIGLEEGILPHARSLPDAAEPGGSDGIAEERRLLYVGITRARQRLTLSWCRTRRRGGQSATVLPSRYLEDLPEPLLNRVVSGASSLTAEESTELRQNFFSHMKTMFAD